MNLARLASCVALLAACSGDRAPYLVGAAGPWRESYGEMSRRGIDLAVDEINRGGGIKGSPLRIVFRDDEADGARAATIAQEFVASTDILAVIGHVNSGAMLAASRISHSRAAPAAR